MARPHDTMMNPAIESLLDRSDSKFTLVTLAAKRARQINSYFNQLGDGLGAIVPPQVASVSRKPLSIAFEEISADKITYVRTEATEEGTEEAGAQGDLEAIGEPVAVEHAEIELAPVEAAAASDGEASE